MAMKKYGDAQPAELFVGEEARVVNDHLRKTGKAVSDFSEGELAALNADLENVRGTESATQEASPDEESKGASQGVSAKVRGATKDGQDTQESSDEQRDK